MSRCISVSKVHIGGFKNFYTDQWIHLNEIAASPTPQIGYDIGGLTILVGKNGAGKSSVIDGTNLVI
jgi:AAA15 family ATPase/GTPase